MNLMRYVHTIRYLRPAQIYGRLWYKLYKPKPANLPAPPCRRRENQWKRPICRERSLLGPTSFKFLNQEHDIGAEGGWNDPNLEKLWLYNLHYFDFLNEQAGDLKASWHQTLITRWIRENPPGFGNGWEPYPLSLRIVNWVKWVLAGHEIPPGALQSLAMQVRHLERRLEWHLYGNHLLANAKALVFAGLFFAGPEGDRWLSRGLAVLWNELMEQVLKDGGHFERSPMYHCVVLEDLLDLINLVQAYGLPACPNGTEHLPSWKTQVAGMRSWLKVMSHPDGGIAFFNDAAFGIAPSSAELEQYASRLELGPVEEPKDGITVLADSGYIRLQHGDAVVLLDVGEIGPDYLPGHAHGDTLSFELSINGARVIVNSGTSLYGSSSERERQRSTIAHTTVTVDNADSSETWGGFRVARRARPFGLQVHDLGAEGLEVSCSHDGYQRLRGRVIHRRTWRLKEKALELRDEVSGHWRSAVARLYFSPLVRIVSHSPELNEAYLTVGSCKLHWAGKNLISRVDSSTYHPQFGVSLPNQVLVCTLETTTTSHLLTWSDR